MFFYFVVRTNIVVIKFKPGSIKLTHTSVMTAEKTTMVKNYTL